MVKNTIPVDKVILKLIYVAGNDQAGKEFHVLPSLTAAQIAQQVYDEWPQEWQANKVERAEVLRLIYQGRFLHENVTLNSLNIHAGRKCVMHLVPREKIPQPNIDNSNKEKIHQSETGCCMCSIIIKQYLSSSLN
ncbi:ubiquitin 3 [Brachionus plicatilis]|uniref:Ubiquitin 3 n=1 Tax=Brachionus plicatilis TaxID=10195 RepID=A0A3M7Q9P2_BRAPC|nr:ubiquitin 3 [Brachionus plicatilis]